MDSVWLEIINAQNIMGGLFFALIAVVLLVVLCGLLACFCADKCMLKIPYCVCACLVIVIFLGLGGALIGLSIGVQKAIDEICDGDSSAEYADMITKMYSSADEFYCKITVAVPANTGCKCKTILNLTAAAGRTAGVDYGADGTIVNVMECEAELKNLYESSGASAVFGSDADAGLDKYKRYLEYLGKIEEDYNCSGICAKQGIYYFSDVNKGFPESSCKQKIKDEVAGKQIGMFGFGGIAIALALCLPWLVHFPMYCLPGKGAFCEHSKASLPIINRI